MGASEVGHFSKQSRDEQAVSRAKIILRLLSKGLSFFLYVSEHFFTVIPSVASRLFSQLISSLEPVFASIQEALSYVGMGFDFVEVLLSKSINLESISTLFAKTVSFVLPYVLPLVSTIGAKLSPTFDLIIKFLNQIPYIIGLFLYDGDKRERIFSHLKRVVAVTIAAGVTSGILVGLGLLTGGAVYYGMAIAILLAPVINQLVQSIVVPAIQYVAKKILGEERYKKVADFLNNKVEQIKAVFTPMIEAVQGFIMRFSLGRKIGRFFDWAPPKAEEVKSPTLPKMHQQSSHRFILAKTSGKANEEVYSQVPYRTVQRHLALINNLIPAQPRNDKESFDYFKYVVKEKRPLSALFVDIVGHRKRLEEEAQQTSFLDHLQRGKRVDKIHALRILESALLQWVQFEQARESSVPRALVLEQEKTAEGEVGCRSLRVDLSQGDDPADVFEKFYKYLVEVCPSAMQSILFRGKVATLVAEACAWMTRPTMTSIQEKIDTYRAWYPDGKHDKLLDFFSELLTKTHALLISPMSSCMVGELQLTRDELVERADREALKKKIEDYTVEHYPSFLDSITSRGQRYAILKAIMQNIAYHEKMVALPSVTAHKRFNPMHARTAS